MNLNSRRLLRNIGTLILMTALLFFAVSCGGVQRNPTSPNFGNQGEGMPTPGQGDSKDGKTGEGEAGQSQAWGEGKILEGDYDTLVVQAESFLETGDLQGAYNAYYSALVQKPGDAQAGFGMVLTQLARNWRTFSIFTGAGSDKLYYGTPLAIQHEIMPNPVSSEDSYLLRIFTIGRRYEENFNSSMPTWSTRFVKLPPGVGGDTGPVVAPPGMMDGMTNFPVPSAGDDGDAGMNAEMYYACPMKEHTKIFTDPDAKCPECGMSVVKIDTDMKGGHNMGGEEEGGEEEPEAPEPSPESSGEGEAGAGEWPQNWKPLSKERDPPAGGIIDDFKEEIGAGDPGGYTNPDLMGGVEGEPYMSGLPGMLPEGTAPIDAEYFEQELSKTIMALLDDSAGIRMDNMLPFNLNELVTNLESLVSILEDLSDQIDDSFDFQVGLVMRDKTEKYRIVFKREDYDLLHAEIQILTGIAKFVSAYDQQGGFMYYYLQAEDLDSDGLIMPVEYYPIPGFGTLVEEGAEILDDARDYLLEGLENAESVWDLVLSRAFDDSVDTTNEMLAISSGGLQLALLEAQKDIYREFSSNFDDTFDAYLDSAGSLIEVQVRPSVLFDGSIGDIRAFLPCLDTAGTVIPCGDGVELWPDPTFGGLFPEGLEDETTLMKAGTVTGFIANNVMQFIDDGKISYFGGESKINEDGSFKLAGVEFNELTGLYITISFGEGLTWNGVIRSLTENISTIEQMPFPQNMGIDTGPEGIYAPGNDGMLRTPPGGGGTTESGGTGSGGGAVLG